VSSPIVVYGGGGHGRVVIDALRLAGRYDPVAVLDPARSGAVDGVPVSDDDAAAALRAAGVEAAVIAAGSVGDPALRRRLYAKALSAGFTLPAIVHPRASVAATASLSPGCFVAAGAVVGPGARLGVCVIVNSNAVVDHDCALGDFVHVAPGAALSGDVVAGDDVHVGTGACVVQGLHIGAGSIVGAGAAVVADVPEGAVAVGVPARGRPR
jgi:sugar O-acyltransferase (sialic acid O-acetyltransferase NeuD family)